MEYQTIKENGEVKFVVLPIKSFQAILDRIEDESDLRDIREAKNSRIKFSWTTIITLTSTPFVCIILTKKRLK